MSIEKTCKISNCDRTGVYIKKSNGKFLIKGYCSAHYQRSKKGQDMNSDILTFKRKPRISNDILEIPLDENGVAMSISDSSLFDKLAEHLWVKNAYGYAVTNIVNEEGRKTQIKMHHLVIGKPPTGMMVDHINRNRLDNRLVNLRFATPSLNCRNRGGTSSTGYKGVYKIGSKFQSSFVCDSKKVRLGTFDTAIEASRVYKKAILERFGEELY